jgi:hypothetical protein
MRFYLDVLDSDQVIQDLEGIDFADRETAIAEGFCQGSRQQVEPVALGRAATSRYAASRMASTVMVRRRNWSLRQSAGTCW